MRQSLTRLLPYSPAQLFALVGDVELYPQFVPWVTSLRTWNRQESDSVTRMDAEAQVRFAFVRERFSTRVCLDGSAMAIDVALLSGPFRCLENHWRFRPDAAGTLVDFEIDFEFGSRLLETVLAANAHRATAKIMACFEDRARALYGAR